MQKVMSKPMVKDVDCHFHEGISLILQMEKEKEMSNFLSSIGQIV